MRKFVTPETVITRSEFFDLPDYSCSIPTGVVIGKRWRRRVHYQYTEENAHKVEWFLCEYIPDPRNSSYALVQISWPVDENHELIRGREL